MQYQLMGSNAGVIINKSHMLTKRITAYLILMKTNSSPKRENSFILFVGV